MPHRRRPPAYHDLVKVEDDHPFTFEVKPEDVCIERFSSAPHIQCQLGKHEFGVCSATSHKPYYMILWQSPNKRRYRDPDERDPVAAGTADNRTPIGWSADR